MNRDKHDLAHFFDFHGPLYAHLGHFMDPDVLKAGHNTDPDENDAEQMDKTVEQMGSGRLPKELRDEPEGA